MSAKKKKLFAYFIAILLIIALLLLYYATNKYQQLINVGSAIADEHCLVVNPLIIERKNHYLGMMKIVKELGTQEALRQEIDKYILASQKYVEVERNWVNLSENFQHQPEYKILTPKYIQEATYYKTLSRKLEMEASIHSLDYLLSSTNSPNLGVLDTLAEIHHQKNIADDKFNKIWDENYGKTEFLDYFTTVPDTVCPDENFEIPDTNDAFPNFNPTGSNQG